MRAKFIFGIISILFLSLLSCQSDEPVGKWGDVIKLSEKEVSFTAESNSVLVTTIGTWWWIVGIELNDDWSYDISDIDTTKENFLIEETEFIVERRNANEIHISMTENQSEMERTLLISLQAGNYFDRIKIIQSGS